MNESVIKMTVYYDDDIPECFGASQLVQRFTIVLSHDTLPAHDCEY